MSSPSCWRICVDHAADVVQQFGRELRHHLDRSLRAGVAAALERREIELERGQLVAGDVMQFAREPQSLAIARALLEQRARGEQVRVGLAADPSPSARRAWHTRP